MKYRNQIQLSEYISSTRGLTYLQGGSRVSISSPISSQDFEQGRMSTFSLLSTRNFESGFHIMLWICLVFPVKISSIQSPVFAVPAMEDYWWEPEPRRRLVAETQEMLSLKSPRRNVTIAWLISGKTFDLLISLSCLFLMRRKPSPYLRMRQMKINTLFKDQNLQKPFSTGWHIPI